MTWRPARSLTTLHRQLQRGAPRAAPPATGADEWGLIGDAAHDPTSDHAPHDFPGWGTQIVTAADFPNRPDLGLDAHQVLDDIRRSHDPRVKYAISNGQMFSSYPVTGYDAWTWRPYRGSTDMHYTHGHLSVVGDQRADGEQPWATIGAPAAAAGEDDDMGASFGPIQLGPDQTSLTIPPVQGGLADPRRVWLNVGADTNGKDYGLRIWGSNGGKGNQWFALGSDTGWHKIASGEVLSFELPKGVRLLTVTRKAVNAGGTVVEPTKDLPAFAGSISVCFERQ